MNSNNQLNIILAQINVKFGNPKANFSNIEQKLKSIDFSHEDNLIVLPELFATGYDLEAIKTNAKPVDQSDIVNFLKNLAIEKKSYIYTSVPELDDKNVYNTALFIDPRGQIEANYRKIHLFRPLNEHVAFKPGNKIVTLSSKFGTLGFSICYDLRFAEVYVNQRNEGAKIFLICAEWPIPRINHWRTLIQARAIEHQGLVIALNRVGSDSTGLYGGNSLIVAPDGEILCQADEKENILKYSLDLDSKINVPFLFSIKDEKRIS